MLENNTFKERKKYDIQIDVQHATNVLPFEPKAQTRLWVRLVKTLLQLEKAT
jgi:hypothetical protein